MEILKDKKLTRRELFLGLLVVATVACVPNSEKVLKHRPILKDDLTMTPLGTVPARESTATSAPLLPNS